MMLKVAPFPNCCGLYLLHGEQYYKTAETYFKDLSTIIGIPSRGVPHVGAFVFEHSNKCEIGKLIKAYIEEHGLGEVVIVPDIPNPVHSGNLFSVYIWKFDKPMLTKHLSAVRKKAEEAEVSIAATKAEKTTAVLTPQGN